MATPTVVEQELLELVNRARLDPQGEFDALIRDAASTSAVSDDITIALRYFGVDLESFRRQLDSYDPVAPVSWNSNLNDAAFSHNLLMIEQDAQEHILEGEAGLYERITAAGYDNATRVSENIYAYVFDALYAHAGFYIDWGYDDADFSGNTLRSNWQVTGDGIQDPAGHRIAILNGSLREVGISVTAESNTATEVGPLVVTQNFGTRSDFQPMLVGVVINDADGDRFYDAGEGLAEVIISATDSLGNVTQTSSWESGGYQMALAEGQYTVTFSGGALKGSLSYQLLMGAENTQLYGYASEANPVPPEIWFGTSGEDLALGTEGSDQLYGREGDDTLLGAAGDDTLNGGSGADMLNGGPGSDVLIVDNTSDRVAESRRWDGHDTVQSSVDFRMGNAHIEDLTLTGTARLGAGNGLNNRITGNTADNLLDGGKGDDTLIGGPGDDIYLVRNLRDRILEESDNGVDIARAFRSYALESNVEQLHMQTVYKRDGTPARLNGIGNELDNTIIGTPFDNYLIGRGGRDTLKGQAGADSFVFDRVIDSSNIDRIIDFNVNETDEGDRLLIKSDIFGELASGVLAEEAFKQGSAATHPEHRLIFDHSSGQLWYDVDGSGHLSPQLIAYFEQNAQLNAEDIWVF